MIIGASTANLYPALTEDALDTLLGLGFHEIEVFLNTGSETAPDYVRALRGSAEAAGGRIRAVHSYLSAYEGYMLFSGYPRRFADGLEVYRGIFAAAAGMGAEYLVLHGDKLTGGLTVEQLAERYEMLYDTGHEQGVTLLQENVSLFRSGHPDFIRELRRLLPDKSKFTLDLKQCRRVGIPAAGMIEAMGAGLAHVHVSDCDDAHDCLAPGRGITNYETLWQQLRKVGFDRSVILELYRKNFDEPTELWEGKQYLESTLSGV